MPPAGFEGPHLLGWWPRPPQLFLLLLLLLLPQPITRAQTSPSTPGGPTTRGAPGTTSTPGARSASTTLGTPSSRALEERARALMRDFPLVDGWVDAALGQVGGLRAPPGMPSQHPWVSFPFSTNYFLGGSPQLRPQSVLVESVGRM